MRDLRLAQDGARRACGVSRAGGPTRGAGGPIRDAADDRARLERAQRRLGARIHAPARAGRHAEIPPARAGPCGGVTVKAVRLFEFGGPDKLVYGEHPMPEVGPGDVLVKVLATSVSRW